MKNPCSICEQEELEPGKDGAVIAFGFWKRWVNEDDPEDGVEFEPNSDEYDVCPTCASLVETMIHKLIDMAKHIHKEK